MIRRSSKPSFKPPAQEWYHLKEGEPFQRGDVYGEGRNPTVIGINACAVRVGQPCPAWMLCYSPRRLVNGSTATV
jgi:hypothetical protein